MSEDIKLSPWFDCAIDGYPIRSGVYQWELYIDDGVSARGCLIHCKVFYSCIAKAVHVNGRFISVQDSDQWRGIVPNAK